MSRGKGWTVTFGPGLNKHHNFLRFLRVGHDSTVKSRGPLDILLHLPFTSTFSRTVSKIPSGLLPDTGYFPTPLPVRLFLSPRVHTPKNL